MEENLTEKAQKGYSETADEIAADLAADTDGGEEIQETPETGEGYTLRHLDEVKTVGRDEVIALAQKGLDYDRVRSKLDAARLRLGGMEDGADRKQADVEAFLKAYPDAAAKLSRGEDVIPDEVWREVKRGEWLVDAYASYLAKEEKRHHAEEVRRLKAELEETRLAGKNAYRSAGSAKSKGGEPPVDLITAGWNSV